ncbi:hypothetical protein ACQ4PT_029439 [Festuca glaucescens]
MTDGRVFNNILLGGSTGTNPGQLEVSSGGLTWNRQGGGETIRIDKADITSVKWMKVPRANELEVRTNDGLFYKFIGFPEQVLWEAILEGNDRSSSNEEAVVTFDRIAILTPRLIVEKSIKLSRELAEKYKGRLEESYQGLVHEVFVKALRGLSGARVTRPGSFRNSQDGYAVKSSLKAEDGLLYPLERGFFFLPKPPTLIIDEEIEFVEFERHGTGGASMSSLYFDLIVKLKDDQVHLFRNIQRSEYHNLFNVINAKNLKLMNLGDGQGTSGGVADILLETENAGGDPYMPRMKNQPGDEESDEEDEDFVLDKDDGESPTDILVVRNQTLVKVVVKTRSHPKRKPVVQSHLRKGSLRPGMAKGVKKSYPDLPPTDISRKLGEMWQKMSSEEKQSYIQQSQVDRKGYEKESAAYRAAAPVDVDSD